MAWGNFYKRVIATALGFLLTFGAFAGTLLLFQQNRKLAEQTALMSSQTALMDAQTERMREQSEQFAMQNEIMTVNLVNELRAQMLASITTDTLAGHLSALSWQAVNDPLLQYFPDEYSAEAEYSDVEVQNLSSSLEDAQPSDFRSSAHVWAEVGGLKAAAQLAQPIQPWGDCSAYGIRNFGCAHRF